MKADELGEFEGMIDTPDGEVKWVFKASKKATPTELLGKATNAFVSEHPQFQPHDVSYRIEEIVCLETGCVCWEKDNDAQAKT